MLLSLFATPRVAPIIDRLVVLVLNSSLLLPASQMLLLGRALLLLLVKCCLLYSPHHSRRSDYRSTCRSDSLSVSPATGVTDVATGKGVAPALEQLSNCIGSFCKPVLALGPKSLNLNIPDAIGLGFGALTV
eukprot:scaffold30096_cov37-Attheya_sp.AAC.2